MKEKIVKALETSLIVSCQPVDGGPMDYVECVVAMAMAAVDGGAKGLRIEGVENVKAVAEKTNVPIVGIVKRDLADSPVRITPFLEDVKALADAGASVIAIDATDRARPVEVLDLLACIEQVGCVAMADCASYEQGVYAAEHGCTFIGSTLSGYTSSEPTPLEPDFSLVQKWVKQGLLVIAEGRYNTPALAQEAIKLGAWGVTVGSAITRVEHITSWYVEKLNAHSKSNEG